MSLYINKEGGVPKRLFVVCAHCKWGGEPSLYFANYKDKRNGPPISYGVWVKLRAAMTETVCDWTPSSLTELITPFLCDEARLPF